MSTVERDVVPATGRGRPTTVRTTCRCSNGRVPRKGFRHLLKRRDLERFIELIPNWDELADGLHWVVLARDTDCGGYYRRGELAICAWESELWWEDLSKSWYRQHAELLERLDVAVRKVGSRWVAEWTEDQARAYQLLHVFLHELGHHHDRMTTRSGRHVSRGEAYAESFAFELEEQMWDDFVRVFPL
jgi:hypothetical protein